MIMQWTVERLRGSGSVSLLAAALLLVAAGVWASPPDDSNAGERETPRAEPQESHSEPPPQAPSEPSSPDTPPSDSGAGDDSSRGSAGDTAVPTGPDERGQGPNRQPPTHHGGGHGHGGGVADDGSSGEDVYDNSQGAYSLPAPSPGGYLFHGGGRHKRDDMGALDLDISPGRAQVFLDGQRIGTADDFDGWPKYLWLPEGTYELVFYLDGYQTFGRRMTVQPSLVVDMDDRLQPGRSILPEDFQPEPE